MGVSVHFGSLKWPSLAPAALRDELNPRRIFRTIANFPPGILHVEDGEILKRV